MARLKTLNPFRGCLLYLFDHLGLGKGSRERRHDVNVTVYLPGFATQVAADRREIGVHAEADGGVEPRLAMPRTKNDVEDDLLSD